MSTAVLIGTLDDDATTLAGLVHQRLGDGSCCVWATEDGNVFIDDPASALEMPAAWMVGTFGQSQARRDIEDDLRALLSERATDGMLDR